MKKTPKPARAPILPPDELIRLGEAAVIELERRGYDVRGKTAAQIKKILRFPPPKRKRAGLGIGSSKVLRAAAGIRKGR